MLLRSACLAFVLTCLFADVPTLATPRPVESAATTPDDQVEREAIGKRVDALLDAGDFAGLNKMAAEFRVTRARTPSGVWKLRVFHMSVRNHIAQGQPAGECVSAAGPMLKRWLAADPSAPAPTITQASVLLEQAWCKRHASAWGYDAFLADARDADRWLAAHKDSASIDPEYYATAEDVAFVTRSDKADFEHLLAEGVAREPGYYGLYFSALKYYLPSTHGSVEEIDRIARLAADKTSASDGVGAYARVYWVYVDCGCAIWQSDVDWPLMKRSMADVIARYPADWNIVNFAKISCQMDDASESAKYLRMLRHDNGLAWASEDERDQCFAIAGLRSSEGRSSASSR